MSPKISNTSSSTSNSTLKKKRNNISVINSTNTLTTLDGVNIEDVLKNIDNNQESEEDSGLPVIKLDIEDIPLLNFDVDEFIKEQDLIISENESKNQLFQKQIQKVRESYHHELSLIETRFKDVFDKIIELFPPGYYPKEILEFIDSHIKYNQLSEIKTKAALRARVFDSIQTIFSQNFVTIGKTRPKAKPIATNQDENTTNTENTRKKKRKIDEILEKWYSINFTQPYPLYADKIFLASFSKISKSKVEEWYGNKRTRVRKQGITQDDDQAKAINKTILAKTTHKKKRGELVEHPSN